MSWFEFELGVGSNSGHGVLRIKGGYTTQFGEKCTVSGRKLALYNVLTGTFCEKILFLCFKVCREDTRFLIMSYNPAPVLLCGLQNGA